MRRVVAPLALLFAAIAAAPIGAQTIRGTVLDAARDEGVSLAGVYLLDRDRNPISVAAADSLGNYVLDVPEAGEYTLFVQRFGYEELLSPLLAITADRDYELDLEMRPEPLGLAPVTVTVRNEEAIDWIRREIGVNPVQFFGFRLLQGPRLAEAKLRGQNNPTRTLRWLYIPVWHGGSCVSINTVPRARGSTMFRGDRVGAFTAPGEAPTGTRSIRDVTGAEPADAPPSCGRLTVNDQVIPNEHIDQLDMEGIAVLITLPGSVRMYTYDFDWSFRRR